MIKIVFVHSVPLFYLSETHVVSGEKKKKNSYKGMEKVNYT